MIEFIELIYEGNETVIKAVNKFGSRSRRQQEGSFFQ